MIFLFGVEDGYIWYWHLGSCYDDRPDVSCCSCCSCYCPWRILSLSIDLNDNGHTEDGFGWIHYKIKLI